MPNLHYPLCLTTGPEIKTDANAAVLYVRHWNQSTFILGPHHEIVTDPFPTRELLRQKVIAQYTSEL
jgi:hypothetical protein